MGSHQAGGRGGASDGERPGADEFESGLDYGAFVEDDDADRTQSLDRTQVLDAPAVRGGAPDRHDDDQHTAALSAEDLAALRGRDAGSHAAGGGAGRADEDIVASRPVAPAAGVLPVDRYPADATAPVPVAASASRASAVPAVDGPTPEEQARLPKAGPRVAQVLLALLAPLVLLLAAVRLVATPVFLWLSYHRPGFPADGYGFTTQDRMHYGSAGLDYVTNLAPSRYLSSLTHGGAALFTEQEVAHMTDVKTVLWIATAALVLLTLVCLALAASLHRTSPGGVRRALFAGAAWLLVAVAALAVLAVIGWQEFFAGFHSLFFADGTWTFSPRDTLIRLYPEQFWTDAAVVVGLVSLLGALATLVATWPTRRRRERSADQRAALEATRLRWAREDAFGQR